MNEELENIKQLLVSTLQIESNHLESLADEEKLLKWLSSYIENLINKDFDALLFLLYRIDVSEEKVRTMLQQTQGDEAATTIAQLILERQKQKLYWRNKFKNAPTQIDDYEKW